MHNQIRKVLGLLAFTVLVSACGALEIGIEHVPGGGNVAGGNVGGVDWRATAETLQIEATRISSGVAQPVPVVMAAAVPTLVPAAIPATQSQATVAYVQGGDIWVRTLPEGEPVRLTFDGRNQEPRWSASGEWLSFLKNPEFPVLWVMRRDGSEAAQVPGGFSSDAYAWSPVEDTIAFTEGGAILLFALKPGNAPVLFRQTDVVASESNPTIGKVAWSPNGQKIAFVLGTETPGPAPRSGEATPDGLWQVDVNGGAPHQLLMSQVPDKGPFVLFGWSGDGESVLYWQAPILSASILADGVSLYRIPAQGGSPEIVVESVLVHDDAVQSQPNGMSQLAVVVGGGREMWHNKRLQVVDVAGSQKVELTPMGQAVSSPAWSPLGERLAYVAMADVEEVGGGSDAQTALQQRQLWIIGADQPEPQPVPLMGGARIESPQWIDDEMLLVASFAEDGRVSLVVTDRWGDSSRVIVDELTPAPEWFGYYGHIDWSSYFSLWRPQTVGISGVVMEMTPTPTLTPIPMMPVAGGLNLPTILYGLTVGLTREQAAMQWGEPDEVTGSGLVIYRYLLNDGVWLWLGFPGDGPLSYAQLELPGGFGRRFAITPLEEGVDAVATEGAATPTPTPAAMDAVTATPSPTAVPIGAPTVMSPLATTTP